MRHRILVSNLGYARDIDGAVSVHLLRGRRHFRTSLRHQKKALDAYKAIVQGADPDLCCMIEVDIGSFTSANFNQFSYLADPAYPLRDVSSKYAVGSRLGRFPMTRGKCNGFMAKRLYSFQRLYLTYGSKRLLYRIELEPGLILYFTHLALGRATRMQQLAELRELADREAGEVLIAGDFNILAGLRELDIFLKGGRYTLLNDRECGTFTLFGKHYLLDLCIASAKTAAHARVQVIDQPFSDHDALLIEVDKA